MLLARPLLRVPNYLINGTSAALGIGAVQLLAALAGGSTAGATALAGAVYASLADTPNPPSRTWRRVLSAGLIGTLTSMAVGALTASTLWLGLAVALIGMLSAMALAWGPRGGPLSFVGILAFVFTMGSPPAPGWQPLFEHALWTALGATLYLGWALACSAVLQRRFRALALAEAIAATARLLRSRAAMIRAAPAPAGSELLSWIADDAALDASLQAARDLLFAARDKATARRQIALLLAAIDVRDVLLSSALDLELLGGDAAGQRVLEALATELNHVAGALESFERALRLGDAVPADTDGGGALQALANEPPFAAGDRRAHMLPLLLSRAHHLRENAVQMRALLHGAPAQPPLSHDELQWFVSPEGWPLAALRPHLRMRSPVLRHALRSGVALGAAYWIGLALPWTANPHWLVLSVAVVMRGTLEQTLSRRNTRVAGTAIGCLFVLAIAQLRSPALSSLLFLVAVGLAHAYVMRLYFVTAAAGTVLALLQAHLTAAIGGLAVAERLADTVLGALLAWAFSYVLPSWERRGIPRIVARLLSALGALAEQTLCLPADVAAERSRRLARREAYDALGAIAAITQRTRAEPRRVRVPVAELAALIAHGHALLAQLTAVKVILARRCGELPRSQAEAALLAAAAEVRRLLDAGADGAQAAIDDDDLALPPPTAAALMLWLQRRLHFVLCAAAQIVRSADALKAATARAPPRPP